MNNLKVYNLMLFTISQCCIITSSSYFQNLFLSSHKNTSYPLTNPSFPTPLTPWKLLICFLSLWICLV